MLLQVLICFIIIITPYQHHIEMCSKYFYCGISGGEPWRNVLTFFRIVKIVQPSANRGATKPKKQDKKKANLKLFDCVSCGESLQTTRMTTRPKPELRELHRDPQKERHEQKKRVCVLIRHVSSCLRFGSYRGVEGKKEALFSFVVFFESNTERDGSDDGENWTCSEFEWSWGLNHATVDEIMLGMLWNSVSHSVTSKSYCSQNWRNWI